MTIFLGGWLIPDVYLVAFCELEAESITKNVSLIEDLYGPLTFVPQSFLGGSDDTCNKKRFIIFFIIYSILFMTSCIEIKIFYFNTT